MAQDKVISYENNCSDGLADGIAQGLSSGKVTISAHFHSTGDQTFISDDTKTAYQKYQSYLAAHSVGEHSSSQNGCFTIYHAGHTHTSSCYPYCGAALDYYLVGGDTFHIYCTGCSYGYNTSSWNPETGGWLGNHNGTKQGASPTCGQTAGSAYYSPDCGYTNGQILEIKICMN